MTVRFVMDTGDVLRLRVTPEQLAGADGVLWDGWLCISLARVKRWEVISYA